jgi:hypothetical protein
MEEMKNSYKILVGRPRSKRLLGRLRHGWENNIKMNLKDVACEGVD